MMRRAGGISFFNPQGWQRSVDRAAQLGASAFDIGPMPTLTASWVCFWHEADVLIVPTNVRFWG
jgi:hypothetical protein